MKKKFLIGAAIAVAVIAIIVVAILVFKAPPMLTQERTEVAKVTLTLNPGTEQATVIELQQRADMYTICALLENAKSRKNFSYGQEGAAQNPAHEITIAYKNAVQGRFFSAGEDDIILRCINPDKPIEKQKFVRGNCEGLSEHLKIWYE